MPNYKEKFEREYFSQVIKHAFESLNGNLAQRTVIQILVNFINECEDLPHLFNIFKKETNFSILGIKLTKILDYLQIEFNFLEISPTFLIHSEAIKPEISRLIQHYDPNQFNLELIKIKSNLEQNETQVEKIDNILSQQYNFIQKANHYINNYQNYSFEQISEFNLLLENNNLFESNSSLLASQMFNFFRNHWQISKSELDIDEKLEALTASLIVLVVLIKGKEIDVSSYISTVNNYDLLKKENK